MIAEEASRVYGSGIPASVPGKRIYTSRQPVGVCVRPHHTVEYPAAMVTRKIPPALAAGCSVVLKSAGETPLTADALAELAQTTEIPRGVINVVTALENTAAIGTLLSTHPRIKKLSFTSSTAVGKMLMAQCAATLKKLSMELGGNSPFVFFDDCKDLNKAVAGALATVFRGSGQTYVAANRIFVQDAVYDEFARRPTEHVKEFELGYDFDDGVIHGPLIHSLAVAKVEAHVREAVARGAKVAVGGVRLPELGCNVFCRNYVDGSEEGHGYISRGYLWAVAALSPFSTESELVEMANASEVGLDGSMFSSDIDRIFRVSDSLDVGMVGANAGMISDAAAPFGGVKESRFGRDGSRYGIEDYTLLKSTTIEISPESGTEL